MAKPGITNISMECYLSMNNLNMYLNIHFLDFGQQDPVPDVLLPPRERGEAPDNPQDGSSVHDVWPHSDLSLHQRRRHEEVSHPGPHSRGR